jgi:hypothetical protein
MTESERGAESLMRTHCRERTGAPKWAVLSSKVSLDLGFRGENVGRFSRYEGPPQAGRGGLFLTVPGTPRPAKWLRRSGTTYCDNAL